MKVKNKFRKFIKKYENETRTCEKQTFNETQTLWQVHVARKEPKNLNTGPTTGLVMVEAIFERQVSGKNAETKFESQKFET